MNGLGCNGSLNLSTISEKDAGTSETADETRSATFAEASSRHVREVERTKGLTVVVGPSQIPFRVSRHVLETSEYFRVLLSGRWDSSGSETEAIHVDCEEDVFRLVLRLMHYGSSAALPESISPNQLFRLHKELSFFGVPAPDLPPLQGSNPILDPCRLAQVTWLASSYKDVSCQCHIRFEARWLVNLYYCYVFCAQCRCTVTLPDDLLLKVLAIAEGVKGQYQMLPEAPLNKFRNGILTCGTVSQTLHQIPNLDGWHCLNCQASSFAVCLDPFHAFCTDCHLAVTTKPGVPKSSSLVGKLWLMGVQASRRKVQGGGAAFSAGEPSSSCVDNSSLEGSTDRQIE